MSSNKQSTKFTKPACCFTRKFNPQDHGLCPGCESGVDHDGPHRNDEGEYYPGCYFALSIQISTDTQSQSDSCESYENCPGCESGVDFDGAHRDDDGNYYSGCWILE